MLERSDLRIVHISAGRYRPCDRDHVTYCIWRELASGFDHYHVIGRSDHGPADWTDGNLRVTLVRSFIEREAEFLATQFALIPMLMRESPDAIVCQSPVLGGLAAILAARRSGARVLSEIHGAEYFAPARVGSGDWLLKKLAHLALHRSTLIRVLSTTMRDRLAKVYGAELLPRTRVLPPRVDLARFSARRGQADNEAPLRLAMVGAVNSNKGQLRLIRAIQNLPFEIELHVVGGGPDLDMVRSEAARLVDARSKLAVVVHGSLAHSAVGQVLRECDALVMYSQSEGTPRALMEAMASGLPVISTDAGFCSDLFENGREGFLLGKNPDEEIIAVLERLHDKPGLARHMGKAAHLRARRDYDSVRLFDEYRGLIEETAAQ